NYRILGVEADLRLEAGAYIGLSNLILEVFMGRACGVYRVPNVKIRARTFKTNKISFGAWRGFGAPQGIFAIETALDLFARERNLDPVQVKKINLAQKGDLSTTGGLYREEVKLPQMLEELLVKSDYYNKLEKFKKDSGKYLKGIGVSFSLLGGGLNGTTERDIQKSKIRLCRNSNGDYGIFSTVLEIGQGPSITLPHIVAQVLEISAEKVKLHTPDSKFCPDSGPTVASRSALIVGKLVERAAQKMKKLLELEGNLGKSLEVEEEYHHPEGFQWDNDKHRGDFNINSSVAINIVEVEIDSETYRIYPKKYWGYYDIGTPLDRKVVMGQIQGGVLQGIAHSHMERIEFNIVGGIVQKNMTDYL
ncbi:MAG: xanthine dehydrogenase family protein molybdopterin-binding subunit, partial [Fusobacteriaceae bacterium]